MPTRDVRHTFGKQTDDILVASLVIPKWPEPCRNIFHLRTKSDDFAYLCAHTRVWLELENLQQLDQAGVFGVGIESLSWQNLAIIDAMSQRLPQSLVAFLWKQAVKKTES